MATIKTVNVTTGKVLHYTIKKDGFKPVTGSKLITGNETININMVSTESSDGAYVFGDRIGGVATFVGYFDSVDPNTQATQKYAYFVLDAKYRTKSLLFGRYYSSDLPLPKYNVGDGQGTSFPFIGDSKESATYNTRTIVDFLNEKGLYDNEYWTAIKNTINPNGQSIIVTVDGVPYSPVMPNAPELLQICNNQVALDLADPTAEEYPNNKLTNWQIGTTDNYDYFVTSSNAGWRYDFRPGVGGYYQQTSGNYKNTDANGYFSTCPIFEIPVN